MVLALGAESVLMAISPRQRPHVERIIDRWTIDSILASVQILSECRARMRGSLQGRLLIEVALVRIARLEDLTELATVVERLASLESGFGPAPRRPDLAVKPRNQAAPAVAAPTPEPAAAPAKPIPISSTARVIAPLSGLDVAPSSPAPLRDQSLNRRRPPRMVPGQPQPQASRRTRPEPL